MTICWTWSQPQFSNYAPLGRGKGKGMWVGGWVWVGEKCKGCSSLTLAGGGSRCRFKRSLFFPFFPFTSLPPPTPRTPRIPPTPTSPPPPPPPHPPNPTPYCILGLDALQPYPPSPKRPDCQYMHQAAPADTKKEFP